MTGYNGWTNRETWALALHINNDQGWQGSTHELVRDTWESTKSMRSVADALKVDAENLLTVDGYIETFGDDHLPAALSRVAEDIGSLWRVEWDELARSILSDLEIDMEA